MLSQMIENKEQNNSPPVHQKPTPLSLLAYINETQFPSSFGRPNFRLECSTSSSSSSNGSSPSSSPQSTPPSSPKMQPRVEHSCSISPSHAHDDFLSSEFSQNTITASSPSVATFFNKGATNKSFPEKKSNDFSIDGGGKSRSSATVQVDCRPRDPSLLVTQEKINNFFAPRGKAAGASASTNYLQRTSIPTSSEFLRSDDRSKSVGDRSAIGHPAGLRQAQVNAFFLPRQRSLASAPAAIPRTEQSHFDRAIETTFPLGRMGADSSTETVPTFHTSLPFQGQLSAFSRAIFFPTLLHPYNSTTTLTCHSHSCDAE